MSLDYTIPKEVIRNREPFEIDGIRYVAEGTEEIVRCKDCKYWATEYRFTGGCVGRLGRPDPEGFCKWGERK